jgi:hypothetical protein
MFLQRIVRNDATKNDPPEIYNARIVVVSLIVSLPPPLSFVKLSY